MHLPFTPCSHAAASSACFASTPAPSVLLATTLTLSAFLNSVPSLILPSISPTFPYGRNVLSHNLLFDQRTFYDAALFLPTNKVSVLIKMNKRESAVFHGFWKSYKYRWYCVFVIFSWYYIVIQFHLSWNQHILFSVPTFKNYFSLLFSNWYHSSKTSYAVLFWSSLNIIS